MADEGYDAGPLADVTLQPGSKPTLVFTRDLPHLPEEIWEVLTDPAQLSRWAPFEPDRNLAQAGAATLVMTDGDTPEPLAEEVVRAEAPTYLEYTWGGNLVRWKLEPYGTGTRLTLCQVVESENWLPMVAAGWHMCLNVADRLIEGQDVPRIVGADAMNHGWQALHDAYAAILLPK